MEFRVAKDILRSSVSNLEEISNKAENDFVRHKANVCIKKLTDILNSVPFVPSIKQILDIHEIVDTLHTDCLNEMDILEDRANDCLVNLESVITGLTKRYAKIVKDLEDVNTPKGIPLDILVIIRNLNDIHFHVDKSLKPKINRSIEELTKIKAHLDSDSTKEMNFSFLIQSLIKDLNEVYSKEKRGDINHRIWNAINDLRWLDNRLNKSKENKKL